MKKIPYGQLLERLERAENTLASLRRGEVDLVIGSTEPLVVRFKSVIEEKERLQNLLDIVRRIHKLIIHEENPRFLLQVAADCLCSMDLFHFACLVQYDEGGNPLIQATSGKTDVCPMADKGVPCQPCPCHEKVSKTGHAIILLTESCCDQCPMNSWTNQCLIGVPLAHEDEGFGVLILASRFTAKPDTEMMELVTEIGQDLGFALYRIRKETIRKEMEKSLEYSEERHRLISQLLTDYAYMFRILPDGSAVCEWISESFVRASGMTMDEIEAQGGWITLVYPEDLPKVRGHVKTVIKGHKDQCEWRFVTRDGQIRWIRNWASPIMDASENRVVRIYGAAQDITDAKAVELERERLVATIEQVEDIIVITDKNGVIQYVNPAFEAITGYTRNEAMGKTPRILKSGKQPKTFYQELWRTILSGKTWRGRMINKRKDGSLYTEDSTISPVRDASGNIVNFISVKRDITEHLKILEETAKLEKQFLQAQKLESVGRLAGGIAHDFNNMLSIILNYGEHLVNNLGETDSLRSEAQEIVNAAQRSAHLTRQLLAFSRKQTLQPEVLNLNLVVQDIKNLIQRMIGEDIQIKLRLPHGLHHVLADRGQLEQVIMNLAVNARDAMPRGGYLTIETANVTLDDEYIQTHMGVVPGDYVRLTVSDTGCGMEKEVLNQIFEPFFTTKEKGKGTGLGLSTVYGIVKQSGGNIWAYSELSKGSTFKIYLPVTDKKPVSKYERSQTDTWTGHGKRVLVVEDEVGIQKLLKMILTRLHFEVELAGNGRQALALVAEKQFLPDLIISDVIMPGMNGPELVHQLKQHFPHLKVLFMSGYTDKSMEDLGLIGPDTPFLQKPFTQNDLKEKLKQLL